uniref:N-acetyltransferase domain-containing protein n=1 Tax=viral metagenome TaxID=1070528 RepID=A0A6C0CK93_9ZZZZ
MTVNLNNITEDLIRTTWDYVCNNICADSKNIICRSCKIEDQKKTIELNHKYFPHVKDWVTRDITCTRDEAQYYILVDNNDIIGSFGIGISNGDEFIPDDCVYLGWFCLETSYRGRKLGYAMLLTWELLAKETGTKSIYIDTTDRDDQADAGRLYRQNGFEIVKKEYNNQFDCTCILFKKEF